MTPFAAHAGRFGIIRPDFEMDFQQGYAELSGL